MMTAEPLVSVVLPFLDGERFLGEAVDSVLAQTLRDWELLLVDDGSTDGSTGLARQAAADHPDRIRYLDHPEHANRGASASRNVGIAGARGRYVAFLDADDVWVPKKLEEQTAIMEAHPEVGLLFGASLYWWSWAGTDAEHDDRVVHPGAEPDRVHHPPTLLRSLYPLAKGVAPCPSSCIVRRDVIERIGGFDDRFRTMYDDQVFLTRFYLAVPVWVSTRCWDRYRRHQDSITLSTGQEAYHDFRRSFLEWFGQHLAAGGITDPDVHAALRRAWWPYDHPHLARVRHPVGIAVGKLRRRLRGRLGP